MFGEWAGTLEAQSDCQAQCTSLSHCGRTNAALHKRHRLTHARSRPPGDSLDSVLFAAGAAHTHSAAARLCCILPLDRLALRPRICCLCARSPSARHCWQNLRATDYTHTLCQQRCEQETQTRCTDTRHPTHPIPSSTLARHERPRGKRSEFATLVAAHAATARAAR